VRVGIVTPGGRASAAHRVVYRNGIPVAVIERDARYSPSPAGAVAGIV
jgi:hypothetical protein